MLPKRYWLFGIVSIGIMGILSDFAEKYDQKFGEILSMDMVFTPMVIIMMLIIDGCYQLFKCIRTKKL
ncbi:hypothetical protein [Anaerosinus massiliensis]|uniref:hypothetical protein n=1 Tax=Massilibacillus massiliensis TaxID=1806837 RepID=UPI000DA5F9A6|nr:hypothetical protein [Massilibacillus massiliensis]